MALGYGNKYGYSYGITDITTLLVPIDKTLPFVEITDSYSPITLRMGVYGGYLADMMIAGAMTDEAPVGALPDYYEGVRLYSFFDDFYERFYITPSVADFGIVVSDTTIPLSIWNAHLSGASMLSVDSSSLAFSEVDILTGGLPQTFRPLEVISVTASADIAGPSSITGTAVFVFEPSQIIDVEVSGTRGRLWPLLPNWSDSVRQTLEYKTEILTSRSGREQRIAQRTTPRKSMEFKVSVNGENRRRLSRILDRFQYVDQVVPDFPRKVRATSVVPASASTMTVDSVPAWLVDNAVIIVVSGQNTSLRYVQAVDVPSKTITFKNAVPTAFPIDSWICYAFVGNLDNNLSSSRLTSDVAELAFRFNATPTREDYIDPGLPAFTFNGREVLLERPNWGQSPGVEFERSTETVDYGRGPVSRFNPVTFGSHIMKWAYLNRDYATAESIIKTFTRMRGQRGEFYMPTWENDIPLKYTVPLGGTALRTDGLEIAEAYQDHPVFDAIMVVLNNGTILFRNVNSIFVTTDGLGSDTVVQLAEAWPYSISPSDITMISWLPCCRFASDTLTVDWITDAVSQMQISVRTLESLPTET